MSASLLHKPRCQPRPTIFQPVSLVDRNWSTCNGVWLVSQLSQPKLYLMLRAMLIYFCTYIETADFTQCLDCIFITTPCNTVHIDIYIYIYTDILAGILKLGAYSDQSAVGAIFILCHHIITLSYCE